MVKSCKLCASITDLGQRRIIISAYVSELYRELHVVAQNQFVDVTLELAVVEEDLSHDVRTLDEAKVVLHRAHDAVVLLRDRLAQQTDLVRANAAAP